MVENIKICTACGGKCCQRYAGGYHPNDLAPITANSLAHRFSDGTYAIDWWEGDIRPDKDEWSMSMFIRPAHVGIMKLRDHSFGGTCIHWNAVGGCRLDWHSRPKSCRNLIPDKNGNCIVMFSTEATALSWVPYQQEINEAATRVRLISLCVL